MPPEKANPQNLRFDPFTDRLARDIRNSLSEALVDALTGGDAASLFALAQDWLAASPGPVYQAYIEHRLRLFRLAIDEIKACQTVDPRRQAIFLWNLGLFFELHELLETVWHGSREPERSALKGWIQAAGVYVHARRGKGDAARRLARRARKHLRNGRACLAFIANLGQLIEALADPKETAPTLIPARKDHAAASCVP